MGEMHNLRCSKCGYGIEANTGIGMLYSEENVVKNFLADLIEDSKITNQAKVLLKEGNRLNENYGHAIYACPNDFYLFNKFYFQLDPTEFVPQYPCPYCQTTLERVTFAKGSLGTTKLKFIKEPKKLWHCPKCGNEELNEISYGNWD
ncbi:hypothetical protein [Companilactobacillus sp. HBUAS56257]|uniref:hypothetical protein n=1 Tax=Companilactobacillus sp. HBUAS56257 TaxID=3109360 RepID=UPI002FEE6DA3